MRSLARWLRTSVLVRYLLVGGLSFLIDIGLLALLHEIFRVPLFVATPAAFLLSFGITYVLQRTLTFTTRTGWGASSIKYALLVAFNTVATTAIVAVTAGWGWPWEVGKVIAVASTTVWNYFGYRYWIFPPSEPSGSPEASL
ncbi:GtrA family protein [Microbacterium sp. W1N]|uniref:GtrA family protein n=1 Tax=Microbacterium festucae TaxID=2977531 RepID=UPI0021BF310F|nr:GtrA family protein [Microbacterium festucae]MCT9818770.1 GtrA family protein [Microbacterium festucae]